MFSCTRVKNPSEFIVHWISNNSSNVNLLITDHTNSELIIHFIIYQSCNKVTQAENLCGECVLHHSEFIIDWIINQRSNKVVTKRRRRQTYVANRFSALESVLSTWLRSYRPRREYMKPFRMKVDGLVGYSSYLETLPLLRRCIP